MLKTFHKLRILLLRSEKILAFLYPRKCMLEFIKTLEVAEKIDYLLRASFRAGLQK